MKIIRQFEVWSSNDGTRGKGYKMAFLKKRPLLVVGTNHNFVLCLEMYSKSSENSFRGFTTQRKKASYMKLKPVKVKASVLHKRMGKATNETKDKVLEIFEHYSLEETLHATNSYNDYSKKQDHNRSKKTKRRSKKYKLSRTQLTDNENNGYEQ